MILLRLRLRRGACHASHKALEGARVWPWQLADPHKVAGPQVSQPSPPSLLFPALEQEWSQSLLQTSVSLCQTCRIFPTTTTTGKGKENKIKIIHVLSPLCFLFPQAQEFTQGANDARTCHCTYKRSESCPERRRLRWGESYVTLSYTKFK